MARSLSAMSWSPVRSIRPRRAFRQPWAVNDEWYVFSNLMKDTMHVIALMDAGTERKKQKMYNTPAYPVIWCSEFGGGRVYYNAMGHREDVWTNPDFQERSDRRHPLGPPGKAKPTPSRTTPKSCPRKLKDPGRNRRRQLAL